MSQFYKARKESNGGFNLHIPSHAKIPESEEYSVVVRPNGVLIFTPRDD